MFRKHLRMAREEGEAQDSDSRSSFTEKVGKLPVVNVAVDFATSTYTNFKESNKLVNFTLTNAEKSVNFVAEQAKPVVRKFEKQIQAVDTLASKGLGTLEEKVPLITKPAEQILGDTRKLYNDKVHSRIEGLRNYGNGTVKMMADYALQKAIAVLGHPLLQVITTSIDGALVITEHFLDVILPPVERELQNDVNSVDEKEKKSVFSRVGDISSILRDKVNSVDEKKSLVSRVGHISSTLHHRAIKHITRKFESLQEKALDIMLYPIVLAQNAKERLQTPLNYVKGLWESLSKEESEADQNGALMKLARLAVRPLIITYVRPFVVIYGLLRSIFPGRNPETTETESQPQDPAHSPGVVDTVKNGILFVVGMLRLVPSTIAVYTFTFFHWLEGKNSSENEVDGILYKENEHKKEENHTGKSG